MRDARPLPEWSSGAGRRPVRPAGPGLGVEFPADQGGPRRVVPGVRGLGPDGVRCGCPVGGRSGHPAAHSARSGGVGPPDRRGRAALRRAVHVVRLGGAADLLRSGQHVQRHDPADGGGVVGRPSSGRTPHPPWRPRPAARVRGRAGGPRPSRRRVRRRARGATGLPGRYGVLRHRLRLPAALRLTARVARAHRRRRAGDRWRPGDAGRDALPRSAPGGGGVRCRRSGHVRSGGLRYRLRLRLEHQRRRGLGRGRRRRRHLPDAGRRGHARCGPPGGAGHLDPGVRRAPGRARRSRDPRPCSRERSATSGGVPAVAVRCRRGRRRGGGRGWCRRRRARRRGPARRAGRAVPRSGAARPVRGRGCTACARRRPRR